MQIIEEKMRNEMLYRFIKPMMNSNFSYEVFGPRGSWGFFKSYQDAREYSARVAKLNEMNYRPRIRVCLTKEQKEIL